jgi:hypothetical protein
VLLGPLAVNLYMFYIRVFATVSNQYESFIYLDLMVKNRELSIERCFKWWISTKLVWHMY